MVSAHSDAVATSSTKEQAASFAAIRAGFTDVSTRSAARWYADSTVGSNGLIQIVQAAIALEILLGDESGLEQIGTTALLANRLAYMIAETPHERRTILARFKQLYKVRSLIVHQGKAVLEERESAALYELRAYANRAIIKQTMQLIRERATNEIGTIPP